MRVLLVIGALSLWAGLNAQAIPLNLTPPDNAPDLMASFQQVSYTAANGLFQAIGYTTDYENGSVGLADIGSYTLTATITSAGVLTSGSLTIQGDVGSGLETLLSAALKTGASGPGGAFGFDGSGGNIFEFLFTVNGGDPAILSDFGGTGADGGIIIDSWFENGGTPFTGAWTSDFSNDGLSGVSDSFPTPSPASVPEPASVLVTLLGAAVWVGLITVSAARNAVRL